MSGSGLSSRVGTGVLDVRSGEMIASDAVLDDWLGLRPLTELLPDVDFTLSTVGGKLTRMCPLTGESALARIEITLPKGREQAWRLVKIEIPPAHPAADTYCDPVTGLPDRRALEMLRAEWHRESPDGQKPHALLFMDLDGFKQINDRYGHAVGDHVLTVLAKRWRNALRSRDLVVRYGGDEFIVLITGVRSLHDAQPVMDRLKRVTAEPITIDDCVLQVDVTIGVAFATSTAMPLEELLSVADQSMYAAKRTIQ